jgi:hypothetical protein
MKRLFALSFVLASIVASVTSASAQVNPHGSVGTGGSMAAQHGVPHASVHYDRSCARLGRNNPWCLNNGGRGGYYGRPIVRRPVYYGHPQMRRPVPVYAANGYARSGFVAGSSSALVIPRAQHARPAAPPPSPEQVARMAKHTVERVPVDCAGGYSRVEGSNRCARITWVPGED